MRYTFAVLILLFFVQPSKAQLVQVPENCINKLSPCLVRAEERDYEFKHRGQLVKILKETIIKMDFDENQNNFEILDGRITLIEQDKNAIELKINSKSVRSGKLFASRNSKNLKVLDFNDFVISEYVIDSPKSLPQVVKADFINKKDFIEFTKYFYRSTALYKGFLASIEDDWKREFDRQTNSQTKVLMRSIASEQEQAALEAARKNREAQETKKVRETFFYRTFER